MNSSVIILRRYGMNIQILSIFFFLQSEIWTASQKILQGLPDLTSFCYSGTLATSNTIFWNMLQLVWKAASLPTNLRPDFLFCGVGGEGGRQ